MPSGACVPCILWYWPTSHPLAQKRKGGRARCAFAEADAPWMSHRPWNERLTFRPRSIAARPCEIASGRRRLRPRRALPLAGRSGPSDQAACPRLRRPIRRSALHASLFRWKANDWSSAGQFDLLAPRHRVDNDTAQRVFAALGRSHAATAAELAQQTGVDQALVHAALTAYTQAGRVMFDLDKSLYRLRELTREPLSSASALREPAGGEGPTTDQRQPRDDRQHDRNQAPRASTAGCSQARTEQVSPSSKTTPSRRGAMQLSFLRHTTRLRAALANTAGAAPDLHAQVEGVPQDGRATCVDMKAAIRPRLEPERTIRVSL